MQRLRESAPRFWSACAALFALVLLAGALSVATAWLLGANWVS